MYSTYSGKVCSSKIECSSILCMFFLEVTSLIPCIPPVIEIMMKEDCHLDIQSCEFLPFTRFNVATIRKLTITSKSQELTFPK